MNNARIISNNIKHIRRLNHLTQVDFRRLVNRNQSQVSRWEKGERDIDLNDAVVICSQFGINLSDFLGSDLALTYSLETLQEQEKVLALLSALRDVQPLKGENLATAFVFGFHRPLPNTTLQKKKHDYWLKASEQFPELPEIRVHSFRHSCASLLINSGATIIYISKYLGHSSTKETLDTYAHFFPNESDRMAEVINLKI